MRPAGTLYAFSHDRWRYKYKSPAVCDLASRSPRILLRRSEPRATSFERSVQHEMCALPKQWRDRLADAPIVAAREVLTKRREARRPRFALQLTAPCSMCAACGLKAGLHPYKCVICAHPMCNQRVGADVGRAARVVDILPPEKPLEIYHRERRVCCDGNANVEILVMAPLPGVDHGTLRQKRLH